MADDNTQTFHSKVSFLNLTHLQCNCRVLVQTHPACEVPSNKPVGQVAIECSPMASPASSRSNYLFEGLIPIPALLGPLEGIPGQAERLLDAVLILLVCESSPCQLTLALRASFGNKINSSLLIRRAQSAVVLKSKRLLINIEHP